MAPRRNPPFRADHVGSLLRPQKLLDARERRKSGAISAAQLATVEDEAIREAVKLQEDVGLDSITDGEFRRTFWHLDFLEQFANVTVIPPRIKARFHTREGDIEFAPPGLRVDGRLSRSHPIFVDHFKFVKAAAKKTAKHTIPSPSNMHFRGGRGAIDETAYPDLGEFYADLARVYSEEVRDLAAAGCRYLQIDEVNFAYLCDPMLREQVRTLGEDPTKLPHTYAKLINESIATRSKDMVVTMHLCRGNFQSAWVAEGGYEPVAEALFNEVDVDGYFLEYDDPRSGDFRPLRYLPKGKTVVLGLVTSKVAMLESKDDLKRRIDEAARYVPLDQLALSPQCGFSSTIEGNKVTVADEIAKLRLVVEVAREVWG
ncbi:MAG: 5-methyltetrahydropteroyltriglutamate--homocysteine S-methyltransferase [Stellaceae bacterium]